MLDLATILTAARPSLAHLHGYVVRGDVLYWLGSRPGPDWHIHGWTDSHPRMLLNGEIERLTLHKRRWRRADRSATTHSRPPEDIGLVYEALVVAMEIWCWLDAASGLHRYVTPCLEGPSRRTVQRWLRRVSPRALSFQSAVRFALIERSEPRPVETLFPNGLSPPGALLRRRWRDPDTVTSLWRGLAMLFVGAVKLDVSANTLLAEARGRHGDPQARSLV